MEVSSAEVDFSDVPVTEWGRLFPEQGKRVEQSQGFEERHIRN